MGEELRMEVWSLKGRTYIVRESGSRSGGVGVEIICTIRLVSPNISFQRAYKSVNVQLYRLGAY